MEILFQGSGEKRLNLQHPHSTAPGASKTNKFTKKEHWTGSPPKKPYALLLYPDSVLVSEFDFHLPDELIAQEPLAARDDSRMLHLRRSSGLYSDRRFRDFPDLLQSDDLLVFNN